MSIFKWGMAVLTWSLDSVVSPFMHRKIHDSLAKRAPKDPYLFRRTYHRFDCPPVTTTNNSSIQAIPLQQRKSVKMSDINIPPNTWVKGEYYLEEHDSSHLHNDFSIIIANKVYRVARTPSIGNKKSGFMDLFPGPGEKVSWIPQPEHFKKEVPNPPVISSGYGKGTTKVISKGHCLVNMSHGGNMHVLFDGIEGTYVFVEASNGSTLMMRKLHKPINFGKHKMVDRRNIADYINDPSYIFSTKKDGAGVEWTITESKTGHKHLQIFSWRPDAKLRKKYGVDTQIEHTQRLKLCDKEVHPSTPLAEGRGEIWCKGENGLLHVNAILNSLPYRSRQLPYQPYLYIHDLVNYEGKNVENLPYDQKLTLMEKVHTSDHRFKIPKHTAKPQAKHAMWEKLKKEPSIDGVVAWKTGQSNAQAIKLKFKHDTDNWYPGTIVDIIPQRGSNKYGYPVVENLQGVQFTCSGVGLTEDIRTHMLKNPDEWIGTGIRYSAERHFESGTPFQPVIKEIGSE